MNFVDGCALWPSVVIKHEVIDNVGKTVIPV